jgi:exodeoxyribonuclease VII small subunit
MQTNQMTYRQAMGELKNIVERLRDGEDVDVDELVADVARAKELIDFCGAKVKKADATIKGIVAELQTAEGATLAVVPCGGAPQNGEGAEDIPF